MMKTKLQYVNKSPNLDPQYAHKGDSGFDLRAWLQAENDAELPPEYLEIAPMERVLIHTGIYVDIPSGCEIQVRPRSGMALKNGLTILNTPGTIDNNYVNEICVIFINLSKEAAIINNGDRIAQAVLCPVYTSEQVKLVKKNTIKENKFRNLNGFGSTGIR